MVFFLLVPLEHLPVCQHVAFLFISRFPSPRVAGDKAAAVAAVTIAATPAANASELGEVSETRVFFFFLPKLGARERRSGGEYKLLTSWHRQKDFEVALFMQCVDGKLRTSLASHDDEERA